ncbi:hypothetical protein BRD13_04010 [Halobacteriales archaeon SW_5_70_135]|nr:MAG: hypothetical protein BRD13_04010 [Halobacteriales archaeon SW_5_70_135]
MSEETTQLDLSDELDRLEALRGGDDAGGELRVAVHDAVLDPDGVEGRRPVATAVDGPADVRGRDWKHPLDALHRPHVSVTRGEERLSVTELVDAVGGPALDGPYVLDRETYVVSAVAGRDPLALRVIEAPATSEQSAGDRIGRQAAVETATVAGYGDRPRFRVFDRYGRPATLEE